MIEANLVINFIKDWWGFTFAVLAFVYWCFRLYSKRKIDNKIQRKIKHKELYRKLKNAYYKKELKKKRVLVFVDKFLEEKDSCKHVVLAKYGDHDIERVNFGIERECATFHIEDVNYECLQCKKKLRLKRSWRCQEIEYTIKKNRVIEDWTKKMNTWIPLN